MNTTIPNYYNDFGQRPTPFEEVLFRADRYIQSRELNYVQSALIRRMSGIAGAWFKNGDVIKGGACIVDKDTGATRCEAGDIYLAGCVRAIESRQFAIPIVGTVNVGVYLSDRVVTEIEDPSLYNPAVGTRGYGEPGAARRMIEITWGYFGDGTEGEFCPVYVVEDGLLRAREAPPNLSAISQAIQRYDVDSTGGNYIVDGLSVTMLDDMPDGTQVYSLDEGRARINGYGITLDIGRRIKYPAIPDVRDIEDEPHTSATANSQRINLDCTPVKTIKKVSITARRTVTVTHGAYVGAADDLPDTSVLELVEVTQGAKTYTKDADYKLTAGQVDWSPGGAEPAIASTYTVTYKYIKRADPVNVDATGFSVTGSEPGTLIEVDYTQMLPRVDSMLMDQDGKIIWITGVSARRNPKPPVAPPSMLLLTTVTQTWTPSRHISQDGLRVSTMQDIKDMRDRQTKITIDLAEIRLALDAHGRDSGIKKGLFADPMLNDSMRDAGVTQTGRIAKGVLALPIDVQVHSIGSAITTPVTANYTAVKILSQPLRTGSMLVNPYQAFDPIPPAILLNPSVDRWMTTKEVKGPAIYQEMYSTSAYRSLAGKTATDYNYPDWVGTADAPIEFLRQIDIQFELRGMGPGEGLAEVTFDGVVVTPVALPGGTLLADAAGLLRGKITIPPNIKAGVKEVVFVGTGGSKGQQAFSGQGTERTVTRRRMVVKSTYDDAWSIDDISLPGYFICSPPPAGCHPFAVDPLAQTYMLDTKRQLCGVNLWFTAKGPDGVLVQVRKVSDGVPSQDVVIETRCGADQIKTGGAVTTISWPPVYLEDATQYAVTVLCDDATTALAVAELGKWDATNGRWVTSQPYQIGVLVSSSNASTWTAHQDKDMAFELLAAEYQDREHWVSIDEITVSGMTDFIVMGYAEVPKVSTECRFEVELPDGSKIEVVDGQVVSLTEPVTGTVKVRARLLGDSTAHAVLYPGVQFIEGRMAQTGDYVSRAITASGGTKLKVYFEAGIPSGAAITVEYQGEGKTTWNAVPYVTSSLNAGNVREYSYEATIANESDVRIRITQHGTAAARPALTNVRAIVI